MIRAPNGSRCAAFIGALLGTALSSGSARAEAGVSIHYESDDQLELARRVASELQADGYAVDISRNADPSPCDLSGPRLVTVPRGTKAWIRLTTEPADPDTIVATICYLGAQPFLQQASPSAPRGKANELALATAEALNGLRSKLPPIESAPERAAPRQENPPPARKQPPLPASRPEPRVDTEGLVNSVVLGAAVVWSLPDFPPVSGLSARATLGLDPFMGIAIDAFVPFTGREIASEAVTAKVRTTWIRIGPRFGGALGDVDFSGAALVGPALTWATAAAAPPRVGTTDVTTGALVTLALFVEYPRRAPVFACASAAASALLPGVAVDLGDDAPRGSWPLEASIGFGARWGSN